VPLLSPRGEDRGAVWRQPGWPAVSVSAMNGAREKKLPLPLGLLTDRPTAERAGLLAGTVTSYNSRRRTATEAGARRPTSPCMALVLSRELTGVGRWTGRGDANVLLKSSQGCVERRRTPCPPAPLRPETRAIFSRVPVKLEKVNTAIRLAVLQRSLRRV